MNNVFEMKAFEEAAENYRPLLLKNTNYKLFEWKDAIAALEHSNVHNPGTIKNMRNGGYIVHEECERVPEIHTVMNDLREAFPGFIHTSNIYMALSSKTIGFGKHVDHMEIFFWQVIGWTEWTVYPTPDTKEVFCLEPRDILYVPPSMPHDVVSLTPRVGVSMSVENIR